MTLAEKAANPPQREATSRCAVGVLLSNLPDTERVALQSMLDGDLWTHKAIFNVLEEENLRVGIRSIERHRQGVCKCPKK